MRKWREKGWEIEMERESESESERKWERASEWEIVRTVRDGERKKGRTSERW